MLSKLALTAVSWSQGPVQIIRGADQTQMSEGLGEIAQRFTTGARFFGIKSKMVGLLQHSFEEEACLIEASRICPPGARKGLYKPESADVKCALITV
jgi:hypothetical protein